MAGLLRRKTRIVKGRSTPPDPITKDNAASDIACWNLSDLKK